MTNRGSILVIGKIIDMMDGVIGSIVLGIDMLVNGKMESNKVGDSF